MSFPVTKAVQIGGIAGLLLTLTAGEAASQVNARAMQQYFQQQQQHHQQRQQPPGWQQQPTPQQIAAMSLKLSGTVDALGSSGLQITTDTHDTWRLQVMPTAHVTLHGTASPDALAPGLFISFSAKVNKYGKTDDKLDKLTIVTLGDKYTLGAHAEGEGSSQPGPGGFGAPGGQAGLGAQGGFGAQSAAAGTGRKASTGTSRTSGVAKANANRAAAATEETYEIVGQITSLKNGKLTVSVPNFHTLKLELADQPQVQVEMTGPKVYLMAQRGDKVQASGMQVELRGAKIREMTIELAAPAETVGKKPARRAATTRAKGDQAEEKATEKAGEKQATAPQP